MNVFTKRSLKKILAICIKTIKGPYGLLNYTTKIYLQNHMMFIQCILSQDNILYSPNGTCLEGTILKQQ